MSKVYLLLSILILQVSCRTPSTNPQVITSDVKNFWEAYDMITSTQDTLLQYHYLDSLYLRKGTVGLEGIRQARNYTPQAYINAINNYPKFWESVRDNTLKADDYINELEGGIEKLSKLYPDLKSNKIYFTIGALRTGGTYLDSMALIGSEMAFADENTDATEFPEEIRQGRKSYFEQNPKDDIVFLAIQEYVHTQQKPFTHNLLSYCLHEGVGDFVANTALNIPSKVPAIRYGKENKAVREKFEKVMYYGNNIREWLWSDAPNEFGVRDLGYYIGYQICENYYNQAEDKKLAIKTMIELDYENDSEIETFIEKANFFSTTLDNLEEAFENRRPTVLAVDPINNNEGIDVLTNQIAIKFSEQMDPNHRRFEYGPLGENAAIRIINVVGWSSDSTTLTLEIDKLEPNKKYQLIIDSGFRNNDNVPLKPYLLDFKTRQ